jgi:hypothetical protein
MRNALWTWLLSLCACTGSVAEDNSGEPPHQPPKNGVTVAVKGLADTVDLADATVSLANDKSVIVEMAYPGYQASEQIVDPTASGFGDLQVFLTKIGYVSFVAQIFHGDLVAAIGGNITVEIPLARDVQGVWTCYGQWVTKGQPGGKEPEYQESAVLLPDVPCGCLRLELTAHANTLSIIGDRLFGKGDGVTWSGTASAKNFTAFRAASDDLTSGFQIVCSR